MLEKKCVLLLYSEGKYDASMLALKEVLEGRDDIYVVAHTEKELLSFYGYNIGNFIYMQGCRGFNTMNKFTLALSTSNYKLKAKNSKKPIKPRKEPKNIWGAFWRSMTAPYRRMYNVIARYTPDLVVCSTPRLLYKAVQVKAKGNFANVSVAALLTDYTLDTRFINHRTNYYFVQNKSIADGLIGKGIDEKKITVVGTPIRECSKTKHSRSEVVEEFGLKENDYNIVMVGGRYGGEVLKNAFVGVIEAGMDCNIIVCTNDNQGLIKFCTLTAKARDYEDRVIFLDDIDDFSKVYALADVMISEPTATVSYEACYHQVPLIVCKGGDKLEKRNAQYLVNNQVAMLGYGSNDIEHGVRRGIEDMEYRLDLAKRQSDFAPGDKAERLADILYMIANRNYGKKLDNLDVLKHGAEVQLLENKGLESTDKGEEDNG